MSLAKNPFVRTAALAACFSASSPSGAAGQSRSQTAVGESAAAEALGADVQRNLDAAQKSLDALLAVSAPRTIENTLELYDTILLHLDAAANKPALLERVHPDPAVRKVAEEYTQAVDKFSGIRLWGKTLTELGAFSRHRAEPRQYRSSL